MTKIRVDDIDEAGLRADWLCDPEEGYYCTYIAEYHGHRLSVFPEVDKSEWIYQIDDGKLHFGYIYRNDAMKAAEQATP